ncbi:MAG: cell division topological specificity factor MinE [Synergistaceae bacterium]|jgi:cell division topological specificity factor|nr:cell division topological specificity factor MinE [Synergistaceae bacterium]
MKVDFFKRWFGGGACSSAEQAKKRLQLVLIHDHTDISPQLLNNLRIDMIAVLRKYMDIDESKIVMNLDHMEEEVGTVALVANIPVLRVKRAGGDDEPARRAASENASPARLQNNGVRGRRRR